MHPSESTYIALEAKRSVGREDQNDIVAALEGFGEFINRGEATGPDVFVLACVDVINHGGLENEEADVYASIGYESASCKNRRHERL